MAKKTTKLAIVQKPTQAEAREKLERRNEEERREREEEGWMLTKQEIKFRVHEVREHLETFDEMIAGLHFDIIHPEEPPSLHGRDDPDMESSSLAESLNPTIAGRWRRLQKHLYDTNEVVLADHDLGPMKWALADMAFGIGVLAGAIFTGASQREIDRLERGLVHAVSARRHEVKE